MDKQLKRNLSQWHGYAIMLGGMIGAGIFVVTGEAGGNAGPAVPFGYIVLLPVLLSMALAFMVFLSTPLGGKSGGAYIHISRTFNSTFLGFIFMWFQYVALLGVMSIMAISFGDYVYSLFSFSNPIILATGFVLTFFIFNVLGVKWFGQIQLGMTIVLLFSMFILVVPGLFHINTENLTPMLPNGFNGFIAILPTLLFSYFGFEQLAQAGAEMKNPQKDLPKTMIKGSIIIMLIYFFISFVAFGVLPSEKLAASQSAMADVASVYLPSAGKWVVALGIMMAFATTLNSLMMVNSRILYSFAEERVIPSVLGTVHQRFSTPYIALSINTIFVLVLLWTNTLGYLLNVAIQCMFILYIGHTIAMMALPFIKKDLYESAKYKPSKLTILSVGGFSILVLGYFSYMMIFSVLSLLLIWTLIGIVVFWLGSIQGKKQGFDYKKQMKEDLSA